MSTTDDHNSEMNVHGLLDDAAAEAILTGRPVSDPALRPVAGLVAEMRSFTREPAPAPSADLAAILAGGPVGAAADDAPATEVWPVSAVRGRRARGGRSGPKPLSRLLRNVAAAGLVARVALGAGVAAAGMTGAAAAGVLPGPVQDAVAGVMETVTPFEFPRSTDRSPEPPPGVVPGDGNEAPGAVPGRPGDGLPGPADPALPSGPETSPPTIAPSPTTGRDPASPAPTAGTPPTTVPGATPTPRSGTTPTTGAPPSEPDTTPGTAPVRQPDPSGAITEPAPALPTPSKPEAGSTGPGTTTGGTGTAPDTAAPEIDGGATSAPVPSRSGQP